MLNFSDHALSQELARRIKARAAGVCDYCGAPTSAPVCEGGAERHHHPAVYEGARQSGAVPDQQRRLAGVHRMTERVKEWMLAHPGRDPSLDMSLDKACNAVCPGFSGGMWSMAENAARHEIEAAAHAKGGAK